jgi:hypothetical protein
MASAVFIDSIAYLFPETNPFFTVSYESYIPTYAIPGPRTERQIAILMSVCHFFWQKSVRIEFERILPKARVPV